MNRPADQRVFLGLQLLLLWAPLPLGSNRTWAMGLLLLGAVALALGAVWAWRHAVPAAQARLAQFRWPLGLLGGLVLLTWLQVLPLPVGWLQVLSPHAALAWAGAASEGWGTLSLDPFQTRIMGSLALTYWLVFAVALLTVNTRERLQGLAQLLVWSAVAQVVLGAILFSLKADYRIFYSQVHHERMIGTYVYHNSLAGYLCMCLGVGIGLMLTRLGTETVRYRSWRARAVAAVRFMLGNKMHLRLMLIIVVIGLVLTRSRMGNSAFFAAMLVVGSLALLLARKTAPRTVVVLIASLILVDVLVVGTAVGLEKVVNRIQETELRVEDGGKAESVEARTEAARASLPIVADYPLFGTGGGSYYNVFLNYRTPQYGYVYVDHTHNDFVEVATDYGLIGLGLMGALVALTLWTVLRVMAKRRNSTAWGMAFGVAMAVVGLLIHSTVDFNLQIPANALTMVVILAMGWAAHALPSGRGR
nr:O-antigen ligase family protein [uncultured Rhodoferax sp.]